jgi:hypothetical protein
VAKGRTSSSLSLESAHSGVKYDNMALAMAAGTCMETAMLSLTGAQTCIPARQRPAVAATVKGRMMRS